MWSESDVESLVAAIPRRKSVRSYKSVRLPDDVLADLAGRLNGLVPLFNDEAISFRLLDFGRVRGRVTRGASYLAAYTERGLRSYANAGFMLEQANLWLSARGIGSWLHGLISPVADAARAGGLPFCFMLTFGNAAEEPNRAGASAFERKPLARITDIDGAGRLLEAVRLAPSTRNRQPWFFTGSADRMQLHKERENPAIRRIAPDVEYLDAGTALSHLWLAAKAEGYDVTFEQESDVRPISRRHEYICTVHLDGRARPDGL